MIYRESFLCIDCTRLVTESEQRRERYRQTKRCKSCYQKWKREQARIAMQKHREKKAVK